MNIQLPTLYPQQETHRDDARKSIAKNRCVILNAPPGYGKTRLSKWILGASANRTPTDKQSGRSLFAVHRVNLVDNATDSFAEEPPLPHGVIMSGSDTSWGERIQVASIDSLLSWFIEDNTYKPDLTFDLIVFDETHSHLNKLKRFLELHDPKREELGLNPTYVLGLTATPKCDGLADVYKEIVPGPSTQWLIDNGFLSPFRYFRATEGQLDKLKKRGGEFTNKSVSEAMDGMSGDLVRDWQRWAEGRPTVGFFPRRSHAKAAAEELRAAGLRVEYVDGETPDDERRNTFRALNDHDIDYIANVQVVERGTDIPRIGCVQVCTAVASVVRWRQMIGRGSRVHPAKTDVLVLDHGGCLKRGLGFFEDDPPWTLDVTERDPGEAAARPTIECPKCRAIYRGGLCANCGYEPSKRERHGQGLEFDGAELKEVKPREKKEPKKKTPGQLMISALYRAGKSRRTWKQAVGIFYRECERQGTRHRVPRSIEIAGQRYEMPRYGSDDGGRYVSSLFPITVGGGHGGDYMVRETETAGSPY